MLDIRCEGSFSEDQLDSTLKTNATRCSCTSCDDVLVTVRLNIRGPMEEGPIPAAQVIDLETQQVVGVTLHNGMLEFEVELGRRKLPLLVLATGYQRTTRTVSLSPTQRVLTVNVTLARLVVETIGHGNSEVVYRLGQWAWLCAQPGSFHKNGTTHHDEVIFKGSYMDANDRKVLDMLDAKRFEMNGERFGMFAVVFLEFEDTDGEPLDANDLRIAVPLDNQEEPDMFAAVHDGETDIWTHISTFSPIKTKRGKRQAISDVILEAPDISLSAFVTLAINVAADCWLQARTFDINLNPFPGPLVTLMQGRMISGLFVLFRFGTNTGGAQTTDDSLVSNAVCLPLDCNDFVGTMLTATLDPSSLLTPVPFPPFTFDPSDGGIPTIDQSAFVFDGFTTYEIADEPRPFYVFLDNCVENAREPQLIANPSDFFSFSTANTPLPSSDQCFIKVTVRDCLLTTNTIQIMSLDDNTGSVIRVETFTLDSSDNVEVEAASGTLEECVDPTPCTRPCASPRPICLPYNCSNSIQVTVTSQSSVTALTTTCSLTDVSVLLSNSILAFQGSVMQDSLTIDTSVLDPDRLNDPELGLYYDPQPMMSRDLCRVGGLRPIPTPPDLTLTGTAAVFECF